MAKLLTSLSCALGAAVQGLPSTLGAVQRETGNTWEQGRAQGRLGALLLLTCLCRKLLGKECGGFWLLLRKK